MKRFNAKLFTNLGKRVQRSSSHFLGSFSRVLHQNVSSSKQSLHDTVREVVRSTEYTLIHAYSPDYTDKQNFHKMSFIRLPREIGNRKKWKLITSPTNNKEKGLCTRRVDSLLFRGSIL